MDIMDYKNSLRLHYYFKKLKLCLKPTNTLMEK